jgi:hypothetical protein
MMQGFLTRSTLLTLVVIAACSPAESPDNGSGGGQKETSAHSVPETSPPGTWHGEREGVKFYPSGENLAYDKPAPTIHPKLTEHSQKMVPGVYQVAENVYLAYGYALTSNDRGR